MNRADRKQPTTHRVTTHVTTNFFQRFRGLMFTSIKPTTSLFITPCNSIHTFGMQSAIDVYFLDKEWKITHIYRDLKPRKFKTAFRSKHCFETAPGRYPQFQVGDILEIMSH